VRYKEALLITSVKTVEKVTDIQIFQSNPRISHQGLTLENSGVILKSNDLEPFFPAGMPLANGFDPHIGLTLKSNIKLCHSFEKQTGVSVLLLKITV